MSENQHKANWIWPSVAKIWTGNSRMDPVTYSGELEDVGSPSCGHVPNDQGSWRIATAGDHRLVVWEVSHLTYCVPVHSRVNLDVDIVSLPVQLLKDKKTDLEVTWPAVRPGLADSCRLASAYQSMCCPVHGCGLKLTAHCRPVLSVKRDKTYISCSQPSVCVYVCVCVCVCERERERERDPEVANGMRPAIANDIFYK
jgi:hypothetical protein